MAPDIDWPGRSGRTYPYYFAYSIAARDLKDEAGNYAFVRETKPGYWVPVYFGETGSLRGRLPTHELLAEAKKLGTTRVMTHVTPGGARVRQDEERDLIQRWNPILNTQHRTTG